MRNELLLLGEWGRKHDEGPTFSHCSQPPNTNISARSGSSHDNAKNNPRISDAELSLVLSANSSTADHIRESRELSDHLRIFVAQATSAPPTRPD